MGKLIKTVLAVDFNLDINTQKGEVLSKHLY